MRCSRFRTLMKCRARGHRWTERKTKVFRRTEYWRRVVAEKSWRSIEVCSCCGRTRRKSEKFEYINGIHSLSMPESDWDKFYAQGWVEA